MNKLSMLRELRIDPSLGEPPKGLDTPRDRWRPLGTWLWGSAILAVIAATAAVFALGLPGRVARRDAPGAKAEPQNGPVSVPGTVLDASGYIVARRQATVSSRLTGQLVTVRVEEGQHVQRGEVIAMIDQRAALAALRQAISQQAQAEAAIVQAQVQQRQQRRSADRVMALNAKGFATRSSADDAASSLESADVSLQIARQRRDAAIADRQVAQINVDNTLVRAPFAGVVIAKAAEPGEIVSPVSAGGGFTRTGISTIVDLDSMEGEIEVSERYVSRIRPAQAVRLVLTAYPSLGVRGCVLTVIPGVDRAKATLKVRVTLLERDRRILPNMAVRATFLDRDEPGCTGRAG